MRTNKTACSLATLLAAALSLGTTQAFAACPANIKKLGIKIHENKLVVTPRKPFNIKPNLFQNGKATIYADVIGLGSNPAYVVKQGQVHVQQRLVKNVNGVDTLCGTSLHFTEPEFTNDPDIDCVTIEIEGDPTDGNEICFDVIVDGIGVMDPRARVTDENALLGSRAEIQAAIDSIDELRNAEGGPREPNPIYDDYLDDLFGITEAEARAFLEEYPSTE